MSSSSHLFLLIQSLSKNEKRYFKLFCTLQQGEKNYLKLFEFMEALDHYDELLIQEHFSKTDFVKNIHVTKNYLYNLILKSLRIYESEKTTNIQLANLWIEIDILERRGLHPQLWDRLQKAKKIAIKYNDHLLILKACEKELSYIAEWETKKTQERLDKIILLIEEQLSILSQEFQTVNTYYQVSTTYRQFHHDIKTLKEKTKAGRTKVFPQTDRYEHSFTTRYLNYYLQALFCRIDADREGYNTYLEKTIGVWKENHYMIKERSRIYKIHLSNYLSSCHKLNKYDSFPEYLKELKSIPSVGLKEEVETFQNSVFYELLYRLNTANYENMETEIEAIEKGLKKYQGKINKARIIAFNYNISLLFFFTADEEKALSWLNKILNDHKNEHRKDIQRFANLLQLIYHYELGNIELVYNLQTTVYRKIKRWAPISTLEKMIFDYIKKILDAQSKKESKALNIAFLSQLLDYKKENNILNLPGLGELIHWLQKKIEA